MQGHFRTAIPGLLVILKNSQFSNVRKLADHMEQCCLHCQDICPGVGACRYAAKGTCNSILVPSQNSTDANEVLFPW